MERNESLLPVAKFIAEYAAHMMGSGVHTSRVKRSSKRIGKAFNTDIKLNVSQKTIVISATHNETGKPTVKSLIFPLSQSVSNTMPN